MDEFKPLVADLHTGLSALQELQAQYDEVGWDISDPAFHKLRHISIHLSALVGKISVACEQMDHNDARNEPIDMDKYRVEIRGAVSNIVFHMAQLANLLDFKLGRAMLDRYSDNAKRFAPTSSFVDINLLD